MPLNRFLWLWKVLHFFFHNLFMNYLIWIFIFLCVQLMGIFLEPFDSLCICIS
uniref:Uncharacterized protein n=1 Tax=Rhizophora mucronata TaxID=61149 RepID=A0A2P2R193_RHIMU